MSNRRENEDGGSVVTISRFADVDTVLRRTEFAQGLHQKGSRTYPFQGGTLVSSDGDPHFQLRRLEGHLFGTRAVARYEALVVGELERVLARTLPLADEDGLARAELLSLIRRVLVPVSAAVVGLDGVDDEEGCNRLAQYAEQLGYGSTLHTFTSGVDEILEQSLEAKRGFISEFLEPSRKRRADLVARAEKGTIPAEELPPDIVTLMLRTRCFGSDNDQYAREAIQYLVGSTSTTVNAASHAVHELARWLERHPEDRHLVDDRSFVHRVVGESLRLNPPAPALYRRVVEDADIGGRRIRSGERIVLDVKAANRDPEEFGDDADRFDPHRYLDDPTRPFGLAFGGGQHICMGRLMAAGVRGDSGGDGIMAVVPTCVAMLFQAGLALDPLAPPELRANTTRSNFTVFPVVFRPQARVAARA